MIKDYNRLSDKHIILLLSECIKSIETIMENIKKDPSSIPKRDQLETLSNMTHGLMDEGEKRGLKLPTFN